MSQRLFIYIAWLGITLLSLVLRLHELEQRPIHADEATGARILSRQLAGQDYTFNPQHFHGPLLSRTSVPIARAHRENSWAALSKSSLRLGPVIAGTLLVLTPLLWRRQLGSFGALAAATLLASSPLLVYYNRMYIHESLLTLFTMLGCAAVFRLSEHPCKRMGIIAGLCIGLMFATKETFVISILSWLPALACAHWIQSRSSGKPSISYACLRAYLLPVALLTLTAVLTASYFYSNGFRTPQGIVDAVRTYFVYETTAGHEKGFDYYYTLLLWPKQLLGIWWCEAVVGVFAVIAGIRACLKRSHLSVVCFFAVATIAHWAIYSSISYKTPWLMLVPWAHACMLGGFAFSGIHELKPHTRIALILLLLGGVAYQTQQSLHAVGRAANDSRNPYAYVPTSQDAEELEIWLGKLATANTLEPLAIVGQAYWPLPWHLRQFKTIGYWPTPPKDLQTFPLVFAMPAQTPVCRTRLEDTHIELPRTLRANVPITLYLRNDIWEQWQQSPE